MKKLFLLSICFYFFCQNPAYSDTLDAEEPESTAEESYVDGMYYFIKKDKTRAISKFEEVQINYPFSKLSKKAAIMEIFLNYISKNYKEVPELVDLYSKLYPMDERLDYLYYLEGMSYYTTIKHAESRRDGMEKCMAAFSKLFAITGGGNLYAKDAMKKHEELKILYREGDMRIIEFYVERKEYFAAIKRANMFLKVIELDRYSLLHFKDRVLFNLVQSYASLYLDDEAKSYFQILQTQFKKSPYIKKLLSINSISTVIS